MSRTSLVTGAAGFVGQHLVHALADRGDEVIAVDLAPEAPASLQRPEVRYRQGDVCDQEGLEEAFAGCDVVFHNASAVHTRKIAADVVWRVNYEGACAVMRACRAAGVPQMVYVSSASVVYEGRDVENGDESLPYAATSQAPYADSKIAAEREILRQSNDELRTLAIRPHVVFGPGDTRFLPAILSRAEAGKLKTSVGLTPKLSDFTYIDNLTDALLRADERLAQDPALGGEAFFITNGEPRPFWDFVGQVLEHLDLPPIKGAVPYRLAWAVAWAAETVDALRGREVVVESGLSRFAVRYMCTHHYFSVDKAKRLLGWEPRVSLDEGIARTCRHLRETGALSPAA